MSMNLGLLVLRVVIGLILMGHGSQKLFGWFGGPGLKGARGVAAKMGFWPAAFWGPVAALGEFGGGALLALGLLTPLAAVGIVAAMGIAVFRAHWKNGFWANKGGYEYALTLLLVSAVLGLVGAGRYSLDALLANAGLPLPTVALFVGTLILAVIAIGIGLALGSRHAQPTATPAPTRTSEHAA